MKFKKAMVSLLSLCLLLSLWPAKSWSQEGEDDFFEDDESDATFDEDNSMPPEISPESSRPGSRNRFNNDNSGGRIPSPTVPSGGSSMRMPAPDGSLEFRLVDPPKYWKPKKRKTHPPVTSDNAAK